jgi:hypothetical protein
MNRGPLWEMMRGVASENFSRARCEIQKKGACSGQFCLSFAQLSNLSRLGLWGVGRGSVWRLPDRKKLIRARPGEEGTNLCEQQFQFLG